MKTIRLEKLLMKPYTAQYTVRGDIGESSTEFFINLFRSVLRKPSIRNVVLFINSNGGDAAAGQIAYNILCKMSKHVTIYTVNVGSCDSAAFTIFSGGDERLALPHSSFTIHYSSLTGADVALHNVNRHHKYLLSDKKWDDALYKSLGYKFTRADQTLLDSGGDLVLTLQKAEKRKILTSHLK